MNLIKKGNLQYPLVLYNRTRSAADEVNLKFGHSVVASTLSEVVATANIIWSCVLNDEALIQAFDEILKHNIKGKIFVECSSVLPEITADISQKLKSAGAELVAMPVFGEPTLAAIGALTCVVAGPASAIIRIKPYIVGVVGASIIDLSGEPASYASLLKLIGNIIIVTTIQSISEMYVLAERTQLGAHHVQKLINTLIPSSLHTIYAQKLISGDYHATKPMVSVEKAIDLAAHVLDIAKTSGASVKSYEVGIESLSQAGSHAGLTSDISGIYGAIRVQSGLPFKHLGESESKVERNLL